MVRFFFCRVYIIVTTDQEEKVEQIIMISILTWFLLEGFHDGIHVYARSQEYVNLCHKDIFVFHSFMLN